MAHAKLFGGEIHPQVSNGFRRHEDLRHDSAGSGESRYSSLQLIWSVIVKVQRSVLPFCKGLSGGLASSGFGACDCFRSRD
jgi:hypothetical protein